MTGETSIDRTRTALFVFGTRPEAIKMAPVVRAFRATKDYRTVVCVTGQHRTMLDQVLEFFDLKADHDLNLMQPNQSLAALAGRAIQGVAKVIEDERPEVVFVQGDTTTAFAGAFAGFQARVPVAHIEAGLRSHQKLSPFPEEMNRVLIGQLADLHFPPLEAARQNLAAEKITGQVHVVGNTVVDALLQGLELIHSRGEEQIAADFPQVRFDVPLVLVTIHRRESFGAPIIEIFEALREIAADPGVEVVYPVHLNPNVHAVAHRLLGGLPNVHLIEPLDYSHFIWMMSKATLILTDSGGVQEEAPSLGVPVLVAREVTERAEGVAAGCAKLVGSNRALIVSEARAAIAAAKQARETFNPYGDGKASERILQATSEFLAGS
jgi:UDP-N-acetylglucosamine 2-epimerase (non-hydrolysing)